MCLRSYNKGIYIGLFGSAGSSGYPTLRIEKNDLKSVTLMEAKAKVKDIAISRERITLKDVLQEGICSAWDAFWLQCGVYIYICMYYSFCKIFLKLIMGDVADLYNFCEGKE